MSKHTQTEAEKAANDAVAKAAAEKAAKDLHAAFLAKCDATLLSAIAAPADDLEKVSETGITPKEVADSGNSAEIQAYAPLLKRAFSAKQRKASITKGDALPDGSFPIENADDLDKAVKAFGFAKDKDKAKAHIGARATALGLTEKLPDDMKIKKVSAGDDLKKFLNKEAWDARVALDALLTVMNLLSSERAEEDEDEEDAAQEQMLLQVISQLKAFIASEISEGDIGGLSTDELAEASRIRDLAKRGARNSKADIAHLGAIHKAAKTIQDHCGSMGYENAADGEGGDNDKADKTGDLAKVADDANKSADDLKKIEVAAGELVKIAKAIGVDDPAAVLAKVDELAKKAKAYDEQPEPAKGAIRAIGKSDDVTKVAAEQEHEIEKAAQQIEQLPPEQRGAALLKVIHERAGQPLQVGAVRS